MITERAIEFIEDENAFRRLCEQLLLDQFEDGLILSPSRGADGGRDATVTSNGRQWLFQFKYISPRRSLSRLFGALRGELASLHSSGGLIIDSHYVLMTNASLSRNRGTGTIDRLQALFQHLYPSITLEVWHASTLAGKINNSPSLSQFTQSEYAISKINTQTIATIAAAMSGAERVERLKDILAHLEGEAPSYSPVVATAHISYLRRSLKRIVLLEDLATMHRGAQMGYCGVDEGMVHFGVDTYLFDQDFTFLLEGTRTLAVSGLGAAHGGWVQVLPNHPSLGADSHDAHTVARLLKAQADSGAHTFVIAEAISRRSSRYHDFIVAPGVGGLLYAASWENCELVGPGKLCRDLVEDFRSVRDAALEIHPGSALGMVEELVLQCFRGG